MAQWGYYNLLINGIFEGCTNFLGHSSNPNSRAEHCLMGCLFHGNPTTNATTDRSEKNMFHCKRGYLSGLVVDNFFLFPMGSMYGIFSYIWFDFYGKSR